MTPAPSSASPSLRPASRTAPPSSPSIRKVLDPQGTVIHAGKDEFAKALALIKDGKPIKYEGVIGPVTFDEFGDITGPFRLWRIHNGAVTTVGEMSTADVDEVKASLSEVAARPARSALSPRRLDLPRVGRFRLCRPAGEGLGSTGPRTPPAEPDGSLNFPGAAPTSPSQGEVREKAGGVAPRSRRAEREKITAALLDLPLRGGRGKGRGLGTAQEESAEQLRQNPRSAVTSPGLRPDLPFRGGEAKPTAAAAEHRPEASMTIPSSPTRLAVSSGFTIPRLFTGLWQIADMERDGRSVDIDAAAAAMLAYARAGFDAFDMADHYGSAELITGRFLKLATAEGLKPFVSTKWCPPPGPMTRDVVRAAFERSLDRLGVESVDLMQFHWWSFEHPAYLDALAEMQEMRREGLIRHLGMTNFDTDHLRLVVRTASRCATNQVSFSLLDRAPPAPPARSAWKTTSGCSPMARWAGAGSPSAGWARPSPRLPATGRR